MDINERILEELISIKKLLTILSQDKLSEFNESIKTKHLTTPQRQKMYDLFDGTMIAKEIGAEIGMSAEAVRLFAVSLEKAGLIEYVSSPKGKCPKRLF